MYAAERPMMPVRGFRARELGLGLWVANMRERQFGDEHVRMQEKQAVRARESAVERGRTSEDLPRRQIPTRC